jgi:uncharacterized membrane protein
MKRIWKNVRISTVILLFSYLAITFFQWDFNPGDWSGFWRFVYGVVLIACIVNFIE